MLPTSIFTLALGIFGFLDSVASHSFDPRGEQLVAYRRNYAHRHRSLNDRCGDAIRRRRLRRSLNKRDDLSPRVRSRLYESFNRRDDTSNTSACLLTPEVTQGPYHVLGELVQQDIRGGQPGVPLLVEVDFVDVDTCEPLTGAWVDVWSANATGYYSGYEAASAAAASGSGGGSGGGGNMSMSSDASMTGSTSGSSPTAAASAASSTSTIDSYTAGADSANSNMPTSSGTTDGDHFLRGVWQSDDDGLLTLYTIVPGWYSGRAPHTHLKVYEESSGYRADNGSFIATGSAHHTGQWFYGNDTMSVVSELAPYKSNALAWGDATKNDADSIYPYADSMGSTATLDLTYVNASDISYGLIGTTVVGINMTYSSAEITTSYWDPDTTDTTTSTSLSSTSSPSQSTATSSA